MDYYNSCEARKFESVLSRIIKYLMASAYCIYYYIVHNMRSPCFSINVTSPYAHREQ